MAFECEERLSCGARLKIPIARRSERMLLSQESVVALQDSDIEKKQGQYAVLVVERDRSRV